MNAVIVNIGDELLIGQVINTNAAWLGEQLHESGIEVLESLVVQDELEDIKAAIKYSLAKAKLVIMTGGLGPTKDDITKKAIAEYFKVDLLFDEDTYGRIERMFERVGKTPTPSHREQSFMPANAKLLYNKMGSAPGMWMEENGHILISLPGVPYEMKWIFENSLKDEMHQKLHTKAIYHKTVLTIGMGEAKIAERIEHIVESFPPNIKMAYLPSLGSVRLRISGSSDSKDELKQEVDGKADIIVAEIPELVFGFNKTSFEKYLGEFLLAKGLTLSTAESCTGGYIAHKITSIPGSSAYFGGSIVSYSNEMKMNILGVDENTLIEKGAVSEETVKEMLTGVLKVVNTDLGIAVSGIAGPGGGSLEKPVGTIWIAVGTAKEIKTEKLQLGKDRITNIQYTALHALNMLRKFLLLQ